MRKLTRRQIILIAMGLLVLAVIVYGMLPTAVQVQTAEAERGPLQVMVEEEGETQVVDRYEVSSPVAAFARRIELEVGDAVQEGQVLVQLEAPRATILDPRSRSEAQARILAAEAGVARAVEEVRAAEATATRATEERGRAQRLAADESLTPQALEQAEMEAAQAEANVEAARAAVVTARAELGAARAALEDAPASNASQPVQSVLRAPAAGNVLAVHRRSEGHVNPGEPLVEIGNPNHLEVHVDVLSQDAVRITGGTQVIIDQWGGDQLLQARVQRVEPQAFTQVSSLGVEERRVTVVAGLASPREEWANIGSNYRVLARFVVWEAQNVMQVPTSALFRTEDGWGVFVVEGNVARRREVGVGHQAGLRAEITSGLVEGETVIVHPSNDIEDGTRVQAR